MEDLIGKLLGWRDLNRRWGWSEFSSWGFPPFPHVCSLHHSARTRNSSGSSNRSTQTIQIAPPIPAHAQSRTLDPPFLASNALLSTPHVCEGMIFFMIKIVNSKFPFPCLATVATTRDRLLHPPEKLLQHWDQEGQSLTGPCPCFTQNVPT